MGDQRIKAHPIFRAHPIFSGAILINYYICIMENNALLSLVSLMLPSNILSRFTLVKVDSTYDTISIHLDEKIPSDYPNNPNIESKGFLSPVTVRDFPIRDEAVNLIVRRRRWLDLHTGSVLLYRMMISSQKIPATQKSLRLF